MTVEMYSVNIDFVIIDGEIKRQVDKYFSGDFFIKVSGCDEYCPRMHFLDMDYDLNDLMSISKNLSVEIINNQIYIREKKANPL